MVNEILLQLGCKPNNVGYRYILDLIELNDNGVNIQPLSTIGYKILSLKYGKSVNCIEKNIQNCINNAWLNGNRDILYKFFGETISENKGKPTNKHFICAVIEQVK